MAGIRVAQATFGERNRGHAMLDASPGATADSQLSGRMDLQGTVPPGMSWEPYFSGFKHGDAYVVARTAPDRDAPRAGMVFSRAFLVPLNEFAGVGEIRSLLRLLEEMGDDRSAVSNFLWEPLSERPRADVALAAALLDDGPEPVVWPKEAGLVEAVAGIWPNLWPAARMNFSFRLAFSPQDVAINPPTLVSTPAALLSRWSGYRIVGAHVPGGDGVALLTGDKASEPLRATMTRLEANPPTIRDLQLIVDLHKVIGGEGDLDDRLGALRTIGYLSSDQSQGKALKASVLAGVVEALASAAPPDILMARNLDLSAFATGGSFWQGVANWSRSSLLNSQGSAAAAQILEEGIVRKDALEPWRTSIAKGTRAALEEPGKKIVSGLWRVLATSPSLVGPIFDHAPSGAKLEAALAREAPAAMNEADASELLRAAHRLKLPLLHAAVASAAYGPAIALDLHLDTAEYDRESVQIALRRASPKEMVALAVKHDATILFELAGEAASNDLKLLAPLDVASARWRAIWIEAMRRNSDCWAGPAKPREAADQAYAALLAADLNVIPLVRCLTTTPLADISRHRDRAALWPVLPGDLLATILDATAQAWIGRFLADGIEERVEDTLAGAICHWDRLAPLLDRLLAMPERGVMLFRDLPQLNQDAFRRWLDRLLARRQGLSVDAAEAMGRLILARRWDGAASQLASAAIWGRADLRPALHNCSDLVGIVSSFMLGLPSGAPASAKWRILEELGTELYPHGPEEQELWSRAEGKRGIFPKHAAGADLWRRVVRGGEQGKAQVSMAKLLARMSEDFPDNPVLAKMRRDAVFGGGS